MVEVMASRGKVDVREHSGTSRPRGSVRERLVSHLSDRRRCWSSTHHRRPFRYYIYISRYLFESNPRLTTVYTQPPSEYDPPNLPIVRFFAHIHIMAPTA